MTGADTSLDVRTLIDRSPVSRRQAVAVAICAAVMAVDGFDSAVVGFLAPAIRQEWGLPSAALAPIFSMGLLGLMLGALVMGPLADRFGRKTVLIAATLLFSAGSFAAAAAPSFAALVVMRFVTGLGLGGAFPNAVTLASEFLPARRRAMLVMIATSGFTAGSAIAGFATAQLLGTIGWRGVMLVCGFAPLVVTAVALAALPESPHFLALRGGGARLRKVMHHLIGTLPEGATFSTDSARGGGMPMLELFRGGLALGTVLLWICFFCSLLVVYLVTNWLPVLLSDRGIPVASAALVTAAFQVGGTIGGIALGTQMDKRSGFGVVGVAYLLGAISIALLGSAGGDLSMTAVLVFVAGAFVSGSQTGINTLAAGYYRSSIRATGVAWATSLGRAGAITGSILGGVLIARKLDFAHLFAIVAAICLVSSAAMGILRFHADRKRPN